jgi:hypothetical protein
VADGADHVLAHAEGGASVIAQKDGRVLPDGIEAFLKPRVAKRKRLMAREGMLHGAPQRIPGHPEEWWQP